MKKKEYEEIKMVSEKFLCKNGKELKIATIGPKEAEQFLKFMKQVLFLELIKRLSLMT